MLTLCEQASALELFGVMKERRVKPNVVTYTTIMKGHCDSLDLKAAGALFDHMATFPTVSDLKDTEPYLSYRVNHGRGYTDLVPCSNKYN